MENVYYLLYTIGLVAVVLGIGYLTRFLDSKVDKQYFKEQDERLSDDRVYDHETGKFYTLEELENGNNFDYIDANKLFSDEEIQKVYFDKDAYPLAHNYLITQGYFVTDPGLSYDSFQDTAIANSIDYFDIVRTYEITETAQLVVMNLHYRLNKSYYSDSYFVGIVSTKITGHFLLEPLAITDRVFDKVSKANSTKIADWNLLKISDEVDEAEIEELISFLPKNSANNPDLVDDIDAFEFVVEAKDNRLFVKASHSIATNQAEIMVSLLKNLDKM